jgi:hypothetical protein
LPLSQFRERGSVCSLLPWVGEGLEMRGRRMLGGWPDGRLLHSL